MGRKKDGGDGCGTLCGTPLAVAGTVWHRAIVNRESSWRIARDLGFSNGSIAGVVRLLKACGYCPSAERLAVAAMIVPDVTDSDIAEWFGKDEEWARGVREKADYWRLSEPIPAQLEFVDDGYQPGDPTPEEIAQICSTFTLRPSGMPERQVGMPQFTWNGKRGSFIHISAE